MKGKNKPNLALLAQGINGIADMYAELTGRLAVLEGRVAGLADRCDALRTAQQALQAETARLGAGQAALTDEVMQEYFYGKRNVGDE